MERKRVKDMERKVKESLQSRLFFRGWVSLRIFLQALITYVGVSYQLELNSMVEYWGLQGLKAALWNLTHSFSSFTLARFMLLPGLCLLYAFIFRAWERDGEKTCFAAKEGRNRRWKGLTVHLPAVLFAGMMVLGWSFSHYNSCEPVLTPQYGQLAKSLIAFWGYDLLYRYLIQYVYLKFAVGFPLLASVHLRKPKMLLWYKDVLMRKPFRTVAFTLFILYLPMMVVSYPGQIVADTVGQTMQGFREVIRSTEDIAASQLDKPLGYMTNHHPVAHTILIHCCLAAGKKILHSWNTGYYLYSILQEIAFICVIAFLIREYIRKYGVSIWYSVGIIVYVFASPLIHNYVILNTKDVFYSLFLLLTIFFWYQVLTGGGKRDLFFLLLFATGVILLRNEGRFVLMLAAAGSLCLNRKARRHFALVLVYTVVFAVGYFHMLFPALGIIPSSRREMLSIPFQQTARYVVKHGAGVTAEERVIIDAVLHYDHIAEEYDPDISDPVKDLYREDATSKELIRYMVCWAKMGLKRPLTYLSAFLNNKYKYVYPDKELLTVDSFNRTGYLFSWLTELTKTVGVAPAQPDALKPLRMLADDTESWLSETSPLSVLMMTSLYPAMALLMLCYSIRKRDPVMTSVCLIPFIVLMVCLAGPTNGEQSRYILPIALCWPFFDVILRPGKRTCIR